MKSDKQNETCWFDVLNSSHFQRELLEHIATAAVMRMTTASTFFFFFFVYVQQRV